jgi:hypothetical protein
MKQRQAVFQAVINVMGKQDGAYTPTTDQRASIINIVAEGIHRGEVDFSDSAKAKYDTFEKVKSYTSGMVSNWLRKDPELNGGSKYTPKNPGSRTGQTDPEVKQLRLLMKSGQLSHEQAEIVKARLEERLAEIQASKAKDVEIDFSVLPAELREQLGIE